MKFLKLRNNFLSEEAKIRDVIYPRQAKAVEDKWGTEFLDLEEIEPTDKIQQGVWELDHDDKMKIFSAFFDTDVEAMYKQFQNLPDTFAKAINDSIQIDLIKSQSSENGDRYASILDQFNIQFPSIDAICILSKPIFKKISVGETKATEVIVRDERGVPVKDENNKVIKRVKEKDEVIYSKNLVNINSFISDYNDCFTDHQVDARMFSSGHVSSVINLAAEDASQGNYEVDYNPFSKNMYLKIRHNPKDILNMSISKFYASCQHLYTGMYRQKVIGNVFDPNTIPAYIIFDTPIMWRGEKISDSLPLCRMMIRNMESFDPNDPVQTFFDRCYPDRCKDAMDEIIQKYTQMQPYQGGRGGRPYYFTPDLPENLAHQIDQPYMDRLNISSERYIGVNTKSITLTPNIDWSKIKISKNAKLKEIIVQSSVLPSGFTDIPMQPDWIKFKYMSLRDLSIFSNLKTDSYAFDKCELKPNVINTLTEGIKKLQIISCDTSQLDLSKMRDLEELHLIYTIDDQELIPTVRNLNLTKLCISGDLLSSKENKKFLNTLKQKGVKIEITGPVL
jgi:hypothetical protein